MSVLDPLRQVLDSRQSVLQFAHQHRPLPFCISVCSSWGSHGAQAIGLLGPFPHFSFCSIQPVHLLLPPLGSHGAEVSKKMALRPREMWFILFGILKIFSVA